MALLDSYGSGIYSAVAVFKLNSSYTGDCMRVRRSSDNTTIEVGFDDSGDLDTDAILSFVGAGDGFVEIWYHQGSAGPEFQNLTFSEQPKIVDSGSLITVKGRPAIEFTGAQQLIALGHGSISDLSVFCVTQANTTAGGPQRVLYCFKDSTNRWGIQQISTENEWLDFVGNDGVSTTSFGFTDHVITSFIWDGSEIDVWKNSSYIGSGPLFAPTSLNTGTEPIYLGSGGGSTYYDGKVQGVLIYTSDKTLQRSNIEGDLDFLLDHKLEANDLKGFVVVDSPDIGQINGLDSSEIDFSTPVLDEPDLSEIGVLVPSEISSTVTLDFSDLGQTHVLQSEEINTTVVVGITSFEEEHVLFSSEIDYSAPVVDTTYINQVQSLHSTDVASTITVEDSNLEQEHTLTLNEVSTEIVVGTPTLSEENALVSEELPAESPAVGSTSINQAQFLSSTSIASSVNIENTSINQDQNLLSENISSTVSVENTSIYQTHILESIDISVSVSVDDSEMVVLIHLVSEELSSTPTLEDSSINQSQRLIVTKINFGVPKLDSPELSQIETLSAGDILSGNVILEYPAVQDLSTLDVLDSSDILGDSPIFDLPILAGVDELSAEDIGYCPYDITLQLEVINRGVQRASKLIPHSEDLDLNVCESLSNIATQLDIINEGLKKASKLMPHENNI